MWDSLRLWSDGIDVLWSSAIVPGTTEVLAQRELQGCTPGSRLALESAVAYPWQVHSGQDAELRGEGALEGD